uniref:C2H2-type domain-containing protein n=1 Tax=Cyprinus carpio TaxID=7962 RepID=A0A8C2IJ58_CYPCA
LAFSSVEHSEDFITYTVPSDDQDQSNVHQTPAEEQALDGTISTHEDVTTGPDLGPDVGFIPNNLNFNETVTPNKNFKCVFCGKSFEYLSHMTRHMRKHSGEKPYICTVCGKRFAQKTYLTTHQRTHSGERPYSCMECGKSFSQKSSLNVHLRSHTGEKPFSCSHCGKSYLFMTLHSTNTTVRSIRHYAIFMSLHMHITFKFRTTEPAFHSTHNHTSTPEEKRFECVFCRRTFNKLTYLKAHMRTHSGEKPFVCTVCGKRFAQKTYLRIHQRTHSGERPYSCMECGKSFAQKSSLNVHLRSHTGEKPYSCSECGKSYAYKQGFNTHQCFG